MDFVDCGKHFLEDDDKVRPQHTWACMCKNDEGGMGGGGGGGVKVPEDPR